MPRARPLKPDSVIDIIAPASPFDGVAFDAGVSLLRARGFRPRFRNDIVNRDRFLAGDDQRRLSELLTAIEAPDSDAIWCVRGGYGTTRLLGDLPLGRIRDANKLLLGFSDVTALHSRWLAAGVPSVHGPMIARLPKESVEVRDRLFSFLQRETVPASLAGKTLVEGRAEGIVAGGNLALLAALCGTPYQPDFTGAIVIVEDVDERSFRLDRMMIQCEQAGLFRGIAGLAFGEFFQCGEPEVPAQSVLKEHAARLNVPALADLPFGHGVVNQAVPLGVRARLDASAGTLQFLEPLT